MLVTTWIDVLEADRTWLCLLHQARHPHDLLFLLLNGGEAHHLLHPFRSDFNGALDVFSFLLLAILDLLRELCDAMSIQSVDYVEQVVL